MAARDAIAAWARLTYGWMGRSPDYKAAFLATLGANADYYAPYQDNARRWYRAAQERVLFMNHAIAHPPVDRHRPARRGRRRLRPCRKGDRRRPDRQRREGRRDGLGADPLQLRRAPEHGAVQEEGVHADLRRRHGHARREADLPALVRPWPPR